MSTRGFADIFSCSVIVFPLPLFFLMLHSHFYQLTGIRPRKFSCAREEIYFPFCIRFIFLFQLLCPKGREDGKANTFIQQPAAKKVVKKIAEIRLRKSVPVIVVCVYYQVLLSNRNRTDTEHTAGKHFFLRHFMNRKGRNRGKTILFE